MKLHKIKQIVALIGINILLLVCLIGILEAISACFVNKPDLHIIPDYYLNHVWQPNSKYVHSEWADLNPKYPVPYTHSYNSQGWISDHDIAKQKPQNTYRIFYVGDSFTEGTVPMQESVPAIIQQKLLNYSKKMSFEVINTGTSSYSPTLYYLLVRHRILEYSPDLIVINVDMTDDFDDWKYAKTLILDAGGNPLACPPRNSKSENDFVDTGFGAEKTSAWNKMRHLLAVHSYSYNLIAKIKRSLIDSPPKNKSDNSLNNEALYQRWMWCQEVWDTTTRKNVDRTLGMLEKLSGLCKEHNVKLIITSVPHYWQYAGDPYGKEKPVWSSRPHFEIQQLCKKIGVPYLNSFSALAPIIIGTPHNDYYYEKDMHFNPLGYRIWADAQFKFLTNPANALLPYY